MVPEIVGSYSGLIRNQGEKSINCYFIRVPFRKKELKYGTPKPSSGTRLEGLGFRERGLGFRE